MRVAIEHCRSLLEMREKGAHHVGRQVGDDELVDGCSLASCCKGQQQDEHVAIARTGVRRQVPLRRGILHEEASDPVPERRFDHP